MSRDSDRRMEELVGRVVDERVEQRVRELMRGNLVREEQAPRSLPLSKLASGGAASGDGLVFDGRMWLPGSVVPASIGDAKGDLIGFSADNTPVKIAAAAGDGYGLTSDSSQSGGVAWRSPAARYKVGTFACPGSTGSLAITGLGFKPGLVEFHTGWANIATTALSGDGAMDGSGNQWVVSNWSDAGNGQYGSSSHCIYLATPAGATIVLASYVSMDTDGFTVSFANVNASGVIRWIAHA